MKIFNCSGYINWNIVDVIGQRDCWWESYWHELFLHICVVVHSCNRARFAFLMWGVASTLSSRLMNFLQLVSILCLQLRYECNISHSCWRDKIYRVFLSVGSLLALQSKQRTWNETTQTEVSVAVKQIQQKANWNKLCIRQLQVHRFSCFHVWIELLEWKELSFGLFACIFSFSECLQVWLPQPSASAASSACRGCSGGLPTPAPQPHRLPACPAFSCGGLLAAAVLLSLTISALDLL